MAIRCRRCTWRAGRAGIAPWCVRCMRTGGWTARTNAFVHFATGMMILRMPPQTPRVAIRFAASFRLAFVRLFVSMRQHVSVPEKITKRIDSKLQELLSQNFYDNF